MFNSMQAQWTLPTGYPVYNVLATAVASLLIFSMHLLTCCTAGRRRLGCAWAPSVALTRGSPHPRTFSLCVRLAVVLVNIFISALLENFDLDEDEKLRLQFQEYRRRKAAAIEKAQYVSATCRRVLNHGRSGHP